MGGNKISPNPHLVETYPDVYLSTGLVAENHARDGAFTREAQDAFALRSHQRAIAAIDSGRFADEIVAVDAVGVGRFDRDEGPRRDTSMEALAKLKPAFHVSGTVTAGNSSQTSDGAAAVLLMSSRARERARADAAGALGWLRDRRRRAGAIRHRSGAGRAQVARAHGRRARGHRPGGTE